jgi:uracil phosphoribosyltransferase
MSETAYVAETASGARVQHRYGENVHILADAWSQSILSRACHPDTKTPALHVLLNAGYRRLLQAASEQLPTARFDLPTRMTAGEPRARLVGRGIDPTHKIVVVDVARAGMIPAHLFQLGLHEIVDPDGVRVDHLFMDRASDPVTGAVTGIAFHGSKIGGDVDGATIFVPDPMGATGRSIVAAIEHYARNVPGRPARIVTCHLIVTPEFIRHVTTHLPGVRIYALRVDRGLSPEDVLATVPGTRWDEERGLDAKDYIVPGAGGLGELINNAWT